jgi:hypothetical protein
MTPLKYKDGNGKEQRTKLHFELDPIELTDWTFENPFEANELRASLIELRDISEEDSRDLTEDEIRTMLGVIKLLAQLSAGRPTEDGQYFLKDPNWTSSYAYRGFRTFLLTNPKEVQTFMTTLLDNDTMEEFMKAIEKANAEMDEEEAQKQDAQQSDSGDQTTANMQAKMREMQEENARLKAAQNVDGSDNA